MGTFEFLMIIVIAVCVILVLVVLSQNPKGGGLSSSFGGGSGSQMFGVQRTNEFLDKATWTLAGIIAGLVILATLLKDNPQAMDDGIGDVPAVEQTVPTDAGTAPANETPAPEAE